MSLNDAQRGLLETVLRDAMIAHYGLGADPAITPLRAKVVPTDPYPQKALFDFLSAKAPQVGNIT
jgi:hypothetical protein